MKLIKHLNKHPLIIIITIIGSVCSITAFLLVIAQSNLPSLWILIERTVDFLINPKVVIVMAVACIVLTIILFILLYLFIKIVNHRYQPHGKLAQKLYGRHLFEYEGYYPINIKPGTNEPSLNSEIYVKALKYFIEDKHDIIAAMDLIYLREDNKQHTSDVLPIEYEKFYEKLVQKYNLEYFRNNFSQDTDRLFRNTIRIINDLGDTLKNIHFEILLHDVRNPLRSIIAGKNLDVSDRRLYGKSTRFVVQYLKNQGKDLIAAMESGSKVAYPKQFNQSKQMKATTTPLIDEQYGLVGILCFNIDIDAVKNMKPSQKNDFFEKYIETFGKTPEFEKEHAPIAEPDNQ